jgi:hypothetical protein
MNPEPKTAVRTAEPQGLQKYLDRAVQVLDTYGILPKNDEQPELVRLLDEVRSVDEARTLAIAKTVQYMSSFNAMVRDNVQDIQIGNRYMDITQLFDSVREDSKRLIAQLDDGKISLGERMSNVWMKMRRGTPSDRFEKIVEVYEDVSKDTRKQLEKEESIMDGYIDFRFALKEAEVAAREMQVAQSGHLDEARAKLKAAQEAIEGYTGDDIPQRSKLELARDEANHAYQEQDRTFQLLKDIAENLSIGYDVGETLIAKLKQTHDVKDQVYRRSVTFFTTNEHVFTILGAVYTSQHGLHEATQSTEAMKEGANKGLEDVAELGRELERAALKAGYGSTISPESVAKLVDAISAYQVESLEMIAELRKESEENAKEIRRVVEDGKRKVHETLVKFALEG